MSGRGLRIKKVLLGVAIGLAAVLAGAEATVRFGLFARAADGTALANALREPRRYGDHQSDDLYWLVQARLVPEESRQAVPGLHPELGWLGGRVDPITFAHLDEPALAGRTPVLLYGDSYAACTTPPGHCFQGLWERSRLSREYAVLNYGVGGYGLDQIHLLLVRSIDRFAGGAGAVVLVSMLVDDDMDRCALSFRGWPKPRLQLVDGELLLERPLLPAPERDLGLGGPLWQRSLLAAIARERPSPWRQAHAAERLRADEGEKAALARRILEDMVARLRARDLPFLFVLFNHTGSLIDPSLSGWREPFLRRTLEELGAPQVWVREWMLAEARRAGVPPERLFGGSPENEGHFNAQGNEIAFQAIRRALLEELGIGKESFPVFADIERTVLRGPGAAVRFEIGERPPFEALEDRERLCVRSGETDEATEAHWFLGGAVGALRCKARRMPFSDPDGRAGLRFLADGRRVFETTLTTAEGKRNVAVDLAGCQNLVLQVDGGGDGAGGDLVVLTEGEFDLPE